MAGDYLGQLFANLALIASPLRILVGGGVGLNPHVLEHARDKAHGLIGGYIEALENRAVFDTYIQPANLRDQAGVLGAIALASDDRPLR
jgi:fructokinase